MTHWCGICNLARRNAVQVAYPGGNGTPLSVTLATAAEYIVNTAEPAGTGLVFVFDSHNSSSLTAAGSTVTGNVAFTLDNTAGTTITRPGGNTVSGDVWSQMTPISSPQHARCWPWVDTLIPSAGTMTTNGNFAGSPPTSGNFALFVALTNGTQISTFASAVPEPGTAALMLLAGGEAVAAFRRHRK